MRVCLVSRELTPFFGAGIGAYAARMARALAEAGHDVHILTEPHPGLAERAPEGRHPAHPGVRIHTVDLAAGDAAIEAYPIYPMRYAMGVLAALRRLHGAHPFRYIEFPDYWGEGFFALRAKRTLGLFADATLGVRLHTLTADCRAADLDDWLDADRALMDHMELASVREADLLIATSRPVLERIDARRAGGDRGAWWNPDQRRARIPLPIDADALAAELGAAAGAAPCAAGAPPTILYYGRMQHLKGVVHLVRAGQLLLDRLRRGDHPLAPHLADTLRFRFIGGDTLTGPLGRSMLDHLGRCVASRPELADRFTFEPARPMAELGDAIRAATICCFPSLWDNFPNAVLEAMSAGVPVVASDAGGIPEIISDGESGLLCRAGDVESLAAALERALTDESLRRSLAAAAPARVRALCDPSAVVGALEAAIAEAPIGAPHTPSVRIAAERPRTAVVIPFYNLGAYLPATLDSVRAQTLPPDEIVIVDDGSTDAASLRALADIERAWGGGAGSGGPDGGGGGGRGGSPPLRVIRKPNGGLGSARNAGLRATDADWVLPLDADDLLHPTFLEKAAALARRDPGAAVVGSLVSYFQDDPERPTGGWAPLGFDRDLLPVLNVGAPAGSLIRRDAALRAGGYDEHLTAYEDWDLWCALAQRGERAWIIPEFLFRYRVRPGSMLRAEGIPRDGALRAYLLRKHPGLALDPTVPLRIQAAELAALRAGLRVPTADLADQVRRRIVAENMRYRLADRVNEALKGAGVQRLVKAAALRARAMRRRRGDR